MTIPRTPLRPRGRSAYAGLATAAVLTTLLSACSSGDPGTPDSGSPRAGDASTVGQCVRDGGYDVDDSFFVGAGTFRQPDGLTADQAEAYARVVSTCAEGTSLASPHDSDAPGSDDDQQLLDLTACLRQAGFSDVDDPVDGVWYSDPAYEGDPSYQAATETCAQEAGLQASG